ncbi:MAG: hypothetical protein KME29_15005 [Calothrix sp. FI2-JRJ7]|jgi:hypothetical protein|nr:hypothetical protein [Calothrix sp. FI2-JRJ7]
MKAKLPDFDSLVKEVMSGEVSFERLQELSQKNLDLARLIAENPACPPELLEIMARRKDNIILANVTANPNTPTEILCNLGKRFPLQFLKNPILSLLVLENPNFFRQIPLNTLYSLRDYILDQYYSNKTNQDVEIYKGLAPDFVLQQLIKDYDSSIRYCVAKHPNTPLNFLEQLATDEYKSTRCAVARNLNTPVHVLEKLAADKSFDVRKYVAKNPNTPTRLILKLAYDPNLEVSEAIIYNPQAPIHIIDILLNKFRQHKDCESIFAQIAVSDEVNSHALEKLSICDIRKVRIYVAGNQKTPPETLMKMALIQNEHWLVLKEIAKNLATPNEILTKLAQERRTSIKEAALYNLGLTDEYKNILLNWQN